MQIQSYSSERKVSADTDQFSSMISLSVVLCDNGWRPRQKRIIAVSITAKVKCFTLLENLTYTSQRPMTFM